MSAWVSRNLIALVVFVGAVVIVLASSLLGPVEECFTDVPPGSEHACPWEAP